MLCSLVPGATPPLYLTHLKFPPTDAQSCTHPSIEVAPDSIRSPPACLGSLSATALLLDEKLHVGNLCRTSEICRGVLKMKCEKAKVLRESEPAAQRQ